MIINEIISISHYEPKIFKMLNHVFEVPLWSNDTFMLDRTGNVMASRGHKHEKTPIYLKEKSAIDYETSEWFIEQFLNTLSDTMTESFSHLTHDIVGRSIKLYLMPFDDNSQGTMSTNKHDLKINQSIIVDLLYDVVEIMIDQMSKKHILSNKYIVDFQKFVNYLKHTTFLDLIKFDMELYDELVQIIRKMSSTIIHELVHAMQMTKQPGTDVSYTSYLKKGRVSDEDSNEVYFASPQEIPAFAHQVAVDVINKAQSKYAEDALAVGLAQDLKKIMQGEYYHDIINHYFDLYNKPTDAKYYQIYKRFLKLVYNEIIGHIEKMKVTEIIKETADAGSTTSANIGTVVNPHISPGSARGKKSYTGSFGKSGTKAPPQPKVVQPKNPDGTAKNALDLNTSLFGGAVAKR